MKRRLAFALSLLLSICTRSAYAETPWPGYEPHLFRWSEDYSSDCRAPKCVRFGEAATNTASFGADYRFKYDNYDSANFGIRGAQGFSSMQHRFLLHSDFHAGTSVRAFVQLGSGLESGRPLPRPGDKDSFDLVQAFVDLRPPGSAWRFRLGRQELAIGRFVAMRDVTNIRRTFDGLRVDGAVGSWSVLAVAAAATRQRTGTLDDDPLGSDEFAAFVFTHKLWGADGFKVDIAALEHKNDHATYAQGPGKERRSTVGVRFYGSHGAWDADAQASYQFGSFTPRSGRMQISAFGAAFEGGYTVRRMPTSPRFAARVDFADGGRGENGHSIRTFDLPYPNLSYLSDAGIFAPRNVWDIQPFVTAAVTRQISATLGVQFLWRVSRSDAVYSSANLPLVAAGVAGGYVASQPYLRVIWKPLPALTFQGTLEYASAGPIIRQAGGRDEVFETVAILISL